MLTKLQREFLNKLIKFMHKKKYCPSYDELTILMNYKSKATVFRRIHDLVDQGYLSVKKNKHRSLEIIKED